MDAKQRLRHSPIDRTLLISSLASPINSIRGTLVNVQDLRQVFPKYRQQNLLNSNRNPSMALHIIPQIYKKTKFCLEFFITYIHC